jgi:hypothetical protein
VGITTTQLYYTNFRQITIAVQLFSVMPPLPVPPPMMMLLLLLLLLLMLLAAAGCCWLLAAAAAGRWCCYPQDLKHRKSLDNSNCSTYT